MHIETRDKINNILRAEQCAVIATIAHAQPQAALIHFLAHDDLSLIFETCTTYRKFQNLQTNARVALVIGWENAVTVQYEGVATHLSADALVHTKENYYQKFPAARAHEHDEQYQFFRVQPTWIRYADYGTEPWVVEEITF